MEKRLQKYLAEAGIASRRKAEEIISQGRVAVNGVIVTEPGTKVSDGDAVKVDGRPVLPEEDKIYIILNKPSGYVTTSKDQFSRPAVVDLVKNIRQRVYPVGRLDYDTTGLLLLTNDGEFTFKLTHPSHEVEKVYCAEVIGIPDEGDIRSFEGGLEIEGHVTAPAKLKLINAKGDNSILEIAIHEGKNRQVRRMCEAIGHPVISLKRIAEGGVQLGDLKEGEWRYLTEGELKNLGGS